MPLVLFQFVALAVTGRLTPYERFDAMRRLDTGGYSVLTNKWFVLLGWSVIFILILLLLVVHRMRTEREKRQIEQRYDELSDQMQLTAAEREILDAIAVRSGSARKDAVFHHVEAFENGLARLMQDVFAEGHNLAYRKRLQAAVYALEEKLGYIKPAPVSRPKSIKEQSSRHIPVGTSVLLSLPGQDEARQIPGQIAANDRYEFVVRPEIPLACQPGQMWRVQYEIGTVTWEIEAIALAASDKGLILNHSDRVHFVNRRRFPRVAVRKKATLAQLPVFRHAQEADDLRPVFFDAQINEIAGPSLRIRTDVELALKDRVLVVFELEPGLIVQDIGLVRDIRQTPVGQAAIVELAGLNDRAVAELVRVTNQLLSRTPQAAAEQNNENTVAEVT